MSLQTFGYVIELSGFVLSCFHYDLCQHLYSFLKQFELNVQCVCVASGLETYGILISKRYLVLILDTGYHQLSILTGF